MVGSNLSDKQLQEIVDKTILYNDKDGDGKISFAEFCDVSGTTGCAVREGRFFIYNKFFLLTNLDREIYVQLSYFKATLFSLKKAILT